MENCKSIPLLSLWEELTDVVLNCTQKFPRCVRHTLTHRIDDLALGILVDLVEVRYTKKRQNILYGISRAVEQLRLLLRLAYKRSYLSHKSYEQVMSMLVTAGKMVGGWINKENGT